MANEPILHASRYEDVPPGSVFSVEVSISQGAGPALVTLIDADPSTADVTGVGNTISRSIRVSAPGCVARVQIPIVADVVGTVTYKVTDAANQLLRPPIVRVLGTAAAPLEAPSRYSGLCLVRT